MLSHAAEGDYVIAHGRFSGHCKRLSSEPFPLGRLNPNATRSRRPNGASAWP